MSINEKSLLKAQLYLGFHMVGYYHRLYDEQWPKEAQICESRRNALRPSSLTRNISTFFTVGENVRSAHTSCPAMEIYGTQIVTKKRTGRGGV